ncbi:MAG TPA: FAD-dependent oxidoreductase [Chryseolinea sp.]|nr:FAD-dependent oxidoreductase [Chryseolinea sp.]
MKELKKHYQNVIIGFGKGGKTLAAYLANRGQDVALIEKSEMMYGGTCINVACIPTKSLITSAEKNVPYHQAIDIKNNLVSLLRQKNFDDLNQLPSVTIINGKARFVTEREVSIEFNKTNQQARVTAERIFINTGTLPFIPDIDGIKTSRNVFTSASLMEQSQLPERLIIIGGGFIGLEFADMYAKYGSKVTLLDRGVFLPQEDSDIAEEIYKVMIAKNINIITGAAVERIRNSPGGDVIIGFKNIEGKYNEIEGSAALVATGRKPNLEGLDVNAAGIKTNAKGFLEVDDQLKTNVKNIWAIGDVNGGPQFTYISLDDFRIIRDQLFGGKYTSLTKRKAVASSVFITPSFAHIGLREKEAIAKGYRIKIAKLPAAAVPRARILNNTVGLLKSVIDADTNKILGCSLFCVEGSEMINTIQVAMNADLDYREIRDTIFTHPSMNEAFNDLYASV